MKRTTLSGVLLLAIPLLSFSQSPWTRSQAGMYVQAAWHTIPAYTSIFGDDGNARNLDRELSESTLQLYAEYGVTDKTTVVASLPFRFLRSGDFLNNTPEPQTAEGTLNGLGNVSVAVRQQLWSKGIQVAGTLRMELPAGSYDMPTGLRTGYDAFTIQPMLSVGKGFGKFYGFAYGSYGLRGMEYTGFVQTGLEGGVKAGPVWIILFTDLIRPLENGGIELPARNNLTSLYVDNQGWWSYGLKGLWQINRFWGVVVSGAGAGWARNVPQNPGLSAGVFFKWD